MDGDIAFGMEGSDEFQLWRLTERWLRCLGQLAD